MMTTHKPSALLRGGASLFMGAAIFAIGGFGAVAAQAAEDNPKCIMINRIDHTEVLNDHQIVFHMLGKKDLVNDLTAPCSTLGREDGFAWESSIPEMCSNLESIRVLRTGQTCLLGE